MNRPHWLLALLVVHLLACTTPPQTSKDKKDVSDLGLDAWTFSPKAWYIDDTGAMTCRMEKVKDKKGKLLTRGMGYAWSKKTYGNFELTLSYKLSEGANSGIFYRTNPKNPVQGGFELQLMDNEGFQKTHGKKDAKKLNGSFYDAKAPSSDPSKPVGEWNTLRLTCRGSNIQIAINKTQVIDVNVDDWKTAGKNPDGTKNKFKTALKDLPRTGHLGLQNHGQKVWFKNIKMLPLP
jgi:hypothetical protein